uniref:Putative neuropeptide-like protein 31 n=1 Tax=Anopheles marajoara TaxID=58244 RepID=A0A2M4C3W7_9DIPT
MKVYLCCALVALAIAAIEASPVESEAAFVDLSFRPPGDPTDGDDRDVEGVVSDAVREKRGGYGYGRGYGGYGGYGRGYGGYGGYGYGGGYGGGYRGYGYGHRHGYGGYGGYGRGFGFY